ncbi:MAG TPA: hypothetical protein VGM64_01870 [Lacunisphaera sp.]
MAAKKTTPEPVVTAPEQALEKKPVVGAILPLLASAREKLKVRDLAGAMEIYEQVLPAAADRSDVLVTISADLGTNGYVREIIELLAPRYDLEKHGAAAGVNLLQAYLATRNTDSAQHLLDLLFSLQRPELEARLIGFSKALSELFISEGEAADSSSPDEPREEKKINLVSISKPIWSYGLEAQHAAILPKPEGKLRKVAFAQLSMPGASAVMEQATRIEDDNGRLSRAFALWMAETFSYSVGYEAVAALGLMNQEHYALFPTEWTAENLRQLNETSSAKGLDYIVAGWMRAHNDDFEIGVRIWEVKKFRELKSFSVRFAPSTANEALLNIHGQLRAYMEWSALPSGNGIGYEPPADPVAYLQALGASISLFLGGKALLPANHLRLETSPFVSAVQANPGDVRANLALITGLQRLKELGGTLDDEALNLARAWLASDAAQALGLSGIEL